MRSVVVTTLSIPPSTKIIWLFACHKAAIRSTFAGIFTSLPVISVRVLTSAPSATAALKIKAERSFFIDFLLMKYNFLILQKSILKKDIFLKFKRGQI